MLAAPIDSHLGLGRTRALNWRGWHSIKDRNHMQSSLVYWRRELKREEIGGDRESNRRSTDVATTTVAEYQTRDWAP